MKLAVKGERIISYCDGVFFVELTQEEMHQVYEEQKRQFMIDDIAINVEGRIFENGMQDLYAKDWSYRLGERLASRVVSALEANEHIQEQYSVAVNMYVEKELKALGIDPDTMKKKVGLGG